MKALRDKLTKLEARRAAASFTLPTFCLPVLPWHPAGEELAPGCYASTYYGRPSVAYTRLERLRDYVRSQPGRLFTIYRVVNK